MTDVGRPGVSMVGAQVCSGREVAQGRADKLFPGVRRRFPGAVVPWASAIDRWGSVVLRVRSMRQG